MNQIDLDKYHRDTIKLAQTMIVKINKIAELDNRLLESTGYNILSDKTTWRYYMNLNGEYHEKDKPMFIESIDTGEQILFSKDNLREHLITQREYRKSGYWYNRLIAEFPSQTILINGVLSPIPYSTSVEAEDYSILYYDRTLVSWNEDQLIGKLQKHINSLVTQLFSTEYIVTDDLFLTAAVQILYADIVKAIHTIRLEDCFTRHTHEFFIWSHIDSFGDFSKYKYSLSQEQVMWLFRNISWITRNPGKNYTFNKLLDNILTKADIPLAEYDLVGDVEFQVEELTPKPVFRKSNLNLLSNYGNAHSFTTPARMMSLQIPVAESNEEFQEEYLNDVVSKAKFSPFSIMKTKSLESSMSDSTNSHADTIMSTVLNEWIYLTAKNIFQGRVVVTNPKTGVQFRIRVDDAYNLWHYLMARTRLEDPIEIQPVYYKNVMKLVPPTEKFIIDTVGSSYISKAIAEDIRSRYLPVAIFFAPDYLIQYSNEVYAAAWKHRKLYSQFYDMRKRARVKYATSLMYESGVVKLGDRETYQDIFDEYFIYMDDFSIEDMKMFAWDIFKRVTGWDTNNRPSLRVKQEELVEIMQRLSSYTVHFITDMNDSTSVSKMPNEIFVGDSKTMGHGNKLEGDFSNVSLNVQSNLHAESSMRSVTKPTDKDLLENESKMSSFIKFKDNSRIRQVNIKDLPIRATKIRSNDRIRSVNLNP